MQVAYGHHRSRAEVKSQSRTKSEGAREWLAFLCLLHSHIRRKSVADRTPYSSINPRCDAMLLVKGGIKESHENAASLPCIAECRAGIARIPGNPLGANYGAIQTDGSSVTVIAAIRFQQDRTAQLIADLVVNRRRNPIVIIRHLQVRARSQCIACGQLDSRVHHAKSHRCRRVSDPQARNCKIE